MELQAPNNNKKKVLLCGGGNAIHVLSSYISAQTKDFEVQILSLFPGEAKRLRESAKCDGIRCMNDRGKDVQGIIPTVITDQASEVADDLSVVILALPSFTHEQYLSALKPRLVPGVIIGAMPGEGVFDVCARHVLGRDFCDKSYLFATETLPWACRIVDYGQSVQVLGTKKEIDIVLAPYSSQVMALVQKMIGSLPKLVRVNNFLTVTLMNINSIGHPAISYAFYCQKDLTIPFDEPPLFYQGANEYTGQVLSQLSDEVLALGRALQERYPGLDMSSLHHVHDWLLKSYGPDIADTTNIYTMLLTNKGFRGLTHPMIPMEVPEEVVKGDATNHVGTVAATTATTTTTTTKYLPNFQSRYFIEDVPCGLVVTRGIAELANFPTPFIDRLLFWCQECMGREYLVDGKLLGKDVPQTRCPQRYGFNDLDTFMTQNGYDTLG